MSGTALSFITQAFSNLNVFQPGVTLPTAQTTQALAMLNLMMGTWAQQLTASCLLAIEFPLVPGQAAYTWGPGGDLPGPKPSNQNSLQHASLLLMTSTPFVAVPLPILTDDMFLAIRIKYLTSSQPTTLYYNPATPLGYVWLWPVPDNAVNRISIVYDSQFGPFADLDTTVYTFPDGYDEAIVYNLERRLAGPYGRDLPAEDAVLARETFANIFRANQRLSDLRNDFALAFGPGHRAGYNIQSGSGGGT